MKKIIVGFFFGLIVFTSCSKNEINTDATCTYDTCATKAPASEIAQVETYLSGAGITNAVKHCSGMYYRITSPATGTIPTACSFVSLNYKASLTNGTVFDQTSTQPLGGTLITLIPGVVNGVLKIQKGGKITLYIPPSLGYGSVDKYNPATGLLVIPANSILIFDIELVDVQ